MAAGPLAVLLTTRLGSAWPGYALASISAWLLIWQGRQGPRRLLLLHLAVWAVFLSGALAVFAAGPGGEVIPRGAAYFSEMRDWIRSGSGAESDPARFIPQHLLHLGFFLLVSAASGGLGGLFLGSFLLGYMSFYVGRLAAEAQHPWAAAVLAWHPWSVLRVLAFLILGVSFSRPLLDRAGVTSWWREEQRWLILGMILWAADLLLKALLAPYWPALLRAALGDGWR